MSFHVLDFRSFGALCGAAHGAVASSPVGDTCPRCLELWGVEKPSRHFYTQDACELGAAGELPQIDWPSLVAASEGLAWKLARSVLERRARARGSAPQKPGAPSTDDAGCPPRRVIFADHVASVWAYWPRAANRLQERASGLRAKVAPSARALEALATRGGVALVRLGWAGVELICRAGLNGSN